MREGLVSEFYFRRYNRDRDRRNELVLFRTKRGRAVLAKAGRLTRSGRLKLKSTLPPSDPRGDEGYA